MMAFGQLSLSCGTGLRILSNNVCIVYFFAVILANIANYGSSWQSTRALKLPISSQPARLSTQSFRRMYPSTRTSIGIAERSFLSPRLVHISTSSSSVASLPRQFAPISSSSLKATVQEFDTGLDEDYASMPLVRNPNVIKGQLENGFSYVILRNNIPSGRFEAHLEILSGSVHEMENQQGMAHLLEHVAYMGSPKRQLISGTGSRTNAYTDFHHTVFYASCPTTAPGQFWKQPILPMAFDALLDVLTCNIEEERLEKERAAVLSEASMINKMEYRVECQILSALHPENRISKRFPIGKENLIKTWTRDDILLYHQLHYRPDNVVLFVVGDVDVSYTLDCIKEKFSSLKPTINSMKVFRESKEFPEISMRQVNRHFPPVVHSWSCSKSAASSMLPEQLAVLEPSSLTESQSQAPSSAAIEWLPRPRIFSHELLQSFSFHLFAKRPMEPVVNENSLRRELMRRMALSALQIRFNVMKRTEPVFTFVDFNQLNWPREGCAVCSMDIAADASTWQAAVKMAVREIRRLGAFGLTNSEFERYKQAILTEAAQSAVQADQMNNEVILSELMEAEACGHTYMHPTQRREATVKALDSISIEDVNKVAEELCEHLTDIDPIAGIRPSAIVACAPVFDRDQNPFSITEDQIKNTIMEALSEEIEALQDTIVPSTLISAEDLAAKALKFPPRFVPLVGKAAKEPSNSIGVVQRRLSNGIMVNMKSLSVEPQRANFRLYVPGGRMLEKRGEGSAGAVLLGARTMQEGGAFLNMSREEVELFCIDHLVMVEIIATQGALIFDFQTVTTPGPMGEVTGLEASMQVAHIILTDFKFEEDAFQRASQSLHEQHDMTIKSLEVASMEAILSSLTGSDERYKSPDHRLIDSLNLETVEAAMREQLHPDGIEVSMSGDVPIETLEQLALRYFGTIPPRAAPRVDEPLSLSVKTLGSKEQLGIYLPDEDERAMGYVAGPCPNIWGFFSDGSTLSDAIAKLSGNREERRNHPLFGPVCLQILQEVANRRLFTVVREERRLTYDASFVFKSEDALDGGWYLVSVTSSPLQVADAVIACKEALNSLKGVYGVTGDALKSAKRTLTARHINDQSSNRFWVDAMSGTQLDCVGRGAKTLSCVSDYEAVLKDITREDIQQLVAALGFHEENMTTCVAIASPKPPAKLKS